MYTLKKAVPTLSSAKQVIFYWIPTPNMFCRNGNSSLISIGFIITEAACRNGEKSFATLTRVALTSHTQWLETWLENHPQKTWDSTGDLGINKLLMSWTSFPQLIWYTMHVATDDNNTMATGTATATALPFVISFAYRNYTQGANKIIKPNATFTEWK